MLDTEAVASEPPPELRGPRLRLRPITEADAAALRAILATPEVAAWWGSAERGFPMSDEPDQVRMAVCLGQEVAGMIQFGEEADPDYRHATIDLFVDPRLRGRGLGAEAIETLVRHLVDDRGHHRITIDPAVDNTAAVRCYEKAGFDRVGVMRSAWRDPVSRQWRDVLLMELVVPRDPG